MSQTPEAATEALALKAAYDSFRESFKGLTEEASRYTAASDFAAAHAANVKALKIVRDFYAAWAARYEAVAGSPYPPDDMLLALTTTAATAGVIGDTSLSEQLLKEILAEVGQQAGYDRAFALDTLAKLHANSGRFAEAIEDCVLAASDYRGLEAWDQCVQMLALHADYAYAGGDRQTFLDKLDQAIAEANRHGLSDRAALLELRRLRYRIGADLSGQLKQSLNSERRRLKQLSRNPNYQAELRMLLAEFAEEKGDAVTAREILLEILDIPGASPSKLWSALQALVRNEQHTFPVDAMLHAERSLQVARDTGVVQMVVQSESALAVCRWESDDPALHALADNQLSELRSQGAGDAAASLLVSRALLLAKAGKFDDALSSVEQAIAERHDPVTHQILLFGRAAILSRSARYQDAIKSTDEALAALLSPDGSPQQQTEWRVLLQTVASLQENAAELESRLDRPQAALMRAERSRGLLLDSQLKSLDRPAPPKVTFETIQHWVEQCDAVAVVFCVANRSTLVLIARPHQPPVCRYSPLTEDRLTSLLPQSAMDAEAWNSAITGALPELSQALMPSFEDLIGDCRVLYLIPDSRLFSVPFAALSGSDGRCLGEHAALAVAPSLRIAAWSTCLRRPTTLQRRLLAVGAGVEGNFSFTGQADAVAAGSDWSSAVTLHNPSTQALLTALPLCDVAHFACHGSVERSDDTLSASQLALGGEGRLTAKQLLDPPLSLDADLVFLNACNSAGYRSSLSSEVSGFWQACLLAGASSLIATQAYIHPHWAERLALAFYREWATPGVSKAQALRKAQLTIRAETPEPLHWASHILIGDFQ